MKFLILLLIGCGLLAIIGALFLISGRADYKASKRHRNSKDVLLRAFSQDSKRRAVIKSGLGIAILALTLIGLMLIAREVK